MASLETGEYTIMAVDYSSRPPTLRPIGLSQEDDSTAVVVLPEGIPPPRWFIQRASEGPVNLYVLRITHKTARPSDGDAVRASVGPPFEWMILRSAPAPPPIGRDSYAVFLPPSSGENRGWGYDSDNTSSQPEIPVVLKEAGMSWYIVRVNPDD